MKWYHAMQLSAIFQLLARGSTDDFGVVIYYTASAWFVLVFGVKVYAALMEDDG